MCGRFVLHHETDTLCETLAVEQATIDVQPRYNIAPTQPVAVVRQRGQDRALDALKWGLVPFWAKDPKIGNRMINARAESIAEKPSFKAALRRRRCLIPASGYYEWQKTDDGKIPHYLYMEDGRPFAMAGLWEEWTSPEEEILQTCTIITTEANAFAARIHHRMPVILASAEQATWLDSTCDDPADLLPLLTPHSADDMSAHPVSTRVNAASFEDPSCIELAA
jgi:putative SOS response-associated peptidase YedK